MDRDAKIIVNNFLKFSFGTWLNAILSFLFVPITTRIFAPEVYGRMSMFLIVINVSYTICMFGIDQAFIRFYNDLPHGTSKKGLLRDCILINIIMWFVYTVIILILPINLRKFIYDNEFTIFILLILTVFSNIMLRYLNLLYRMGGKPIWFSIQSIVINSFVQILAIVFGLFEPSYRMYVIANASASVLVMIIFLVIQRNEFKRESYGVSLSHMKHYVKYGSAFVPTFIITWLNESSSKVILQRYNGYYELGIFSSAFRLVAILSIVQVGFTTFWTPYFYENYGKEGNRFEVITNYLAFIMIALGIIIIALQDVIFLLLGPAYSSGREFFAFLLWIPIMYTISETTVGGINLEKKTWLHIVIATIVFLVNIFTCLTLVPKYGALGASIASAITYLVFFIIRTYFGQKYYKSIFNYTKLVSSILLLLATNIVIYFVRTSIRMRFLVCFIALLFTVFIYKNEFIKILRGIKYYLSRISSSRLDRE